MSPMAILWMLRSRGRLTAEELAARLEVSVRSVYRYIDSLAQAVYRSCRSPVTEAA